MVKIKRLNSFGAILTVIIIGVFLTFLTISSSLQSQTRLQNIDSIYKKAKSLYLAESCVEDIMLRSSWSQDIPENIQMPTGSCDVEFSSNPVFQDITVTASFGDYTSVIIASMILPPGQAKKDAPKPKFGIVYWHQIE